MHMQNLFTTKSLERHVQDESFTPFVWGRYYKLYAQKQLLVIMTSRREHSVE